jgi:hypothetical protein
MWYNFHTDTLELLYSIRTRRSKLQPTQGQLQSAVNAHTAVAPRPAGEREAGAEGELTSLFFCLRAAASRPADGDDAWRTDQTSSALSGGLSSTGWASESSVDGVAGTWDIAAEVGEKTSCFLSCDGGVDAGVAGSALICRGVDDRLEPGNARSDFFEDGLVELGEQWSRDHSSRAEMGPSSCSAWYEAGGGNCCDGISAAVASSLGNGLVASCFAGV